MLDVTSMLESKGLKKIASTPAPAIGTPAALAGGSGILSKGPLGIKDALNQVVANRGHVAADIVSDLPGKLVGGLGLGASALLARKFLHAKPTLSQELFGSGGAVRRALGFGAVAAGLGAGAAAATGGASYLHNRISNEKHYNDALKNNPGLKEHKDEDLRAAFKSLSKFSPDLASDPLAAGAFLRRSMMFKEEGLQPTDIKTLVDTRKLLSEARKNEHAGSLLTDMFGKPAQTLSSMSIADNK